LNCQEHEWELKQEYFCIEVDGSMPASIETQRCAGCNETREVESGSLRGAQQSSFPMMPEQNEP
jgi:hypothetical protein